MDEQHAKGSMDRGKGRLKEAAGALTDDPELREEGRANQAKGDLRHALGNMKDAFRRLMRR
jgi:uncharacterized protein YjbJ (UPF0337 family)